MANNFTTPWGLTDNNYLANTMKNYSANTGNDSVPPWLNNLSSGMIKGGMGLMNTFANNMRNPAPRNSQIAPTYTPSPTWAAGLKLPNNAAPNPSIGGSNFLGNALYTGANNLYNMFANMKNMNFSNNPNYKPNSFTFQR